MHWETVRGMPTILNKDQLSHQEYQKENNRCSVALHRDFECLRLYLELCLRSCVTEIVTSSAFGPEHIPGNKSLNI